MARKGQVSLQRLGHREADDWRKRTIVRTHGILLLANNKGMRLLWFDAESQRGASSFLRMGCLSPATAGVNVFLVSRRRYSCSGVEGPSLHKV